jgi:hypothetical protein
LLTVPLHNRAVGPPAPSANASAQSRIREISLALDRLRQEEIKLIAEMADIARGLVIAQHGLFETPTTAAAVLEFPTAGPVKTWGLSAALLAELREAYPGVVVLEECRRALQWVRTNQLRTAKGMPKFLNAWMARAQDKAPARPGAGMARHQPWQGQPDAAAWRCPHVPDRCGSPATCRNAVLLKRPTDPAVRFKLDEHGTPRAVPE